MAVKDDWMKRISSTAFGIDQGSRLMFADFADGGVMWTGKGSRESRHVIGFSEPFTGIPVVMASISLMDIDRDANVRAEIVAEHITETGFHLVFRTWGDSRVARIRAEWTAFGGLRDEDAWEVE